MNYLYLQVDLYAVLVPLIFSFHPKINFYKEWKAAFAAILITAFFFLAWDVLFTRMKVWGFNPKYITGIYLFNLPIEEVLFFICIPYSCMFSYHSLKMHVFKSNRPLKNSFTYLFAFLMLVLAVLFYDKWYTVSTFSLTGVFLLFIVKRFNGNLRNFYLTYLLMLIPFLIVNGILTGTGIAEEVVWYNNAENLGLRVITIPVEDVFYGMLMILSTVFFFEKFSSVAQTKQINSLL